MAVGTRSRNNNYNVDRLGIITMNPELVVVKLLRLFLDTLGSLLRVLMNILGPFTPVRWMFIALFPAALMVIAGVVALFIPVSWTGLLISWVILIAVATAVSTDEPS